MVDCAHVRRELLARRFALGEAPQGPAGIYAFFLFDPSALEPLSVPRGGERDGLLYIGMTSPERSGKARDHIECADSGGSTLRRSLGAILKGRLVPSLRAMRTRRADPRSWQNYRFQDEGEVVLTKWMKAHLQMNFVALEATRVDIEACERALIGQLEPPLNLTDWLNQQATEIKRLRSLCAEEARGHL